MGITKWPAAAAGGGAGDVLAADLASNANAKGASTIGIEDAGGLITATTVEAALAELAPSSAGDMGVMYYAQLARAFTGVTDRNLAFYGDDLFLNAVLGFDQISGTGAVGPAQVAGAGVIELVGPSAGAGYVFRNNPAATHVTPNLRTKKWFAVSRLANSSAASTAVNTRMGAYLYNGRVIGAGIDGLLSLTKYCFISHATDYVGTVLSTVNQPALGTFSYVWFGCDGTNVKGSFADGSGVHEAAVQIATAATMTSASGQWQMGVTPLGAVTQVDKVQFDLIYLWCER